jgi:hypothetical protein
MIRIIINNINRNKVIYQDGNINHYLMIVNNIYHLINNISHLVNNIYPLLNNICHLVNNIYHHKPIASLNRI